MYVFNRNVCPHFRRDAIAYRTRADGRTVRECHERVKVGAGAAVHAVHAAWCLNSVPKHFRKPAACLSLEFGSH